MRLRGLRIRALLQFSGTVAALLALVLLGFPARPAQLQDLADVLALTRTLALEESLADLLAPSVREKYRELWRAARSAGREQRAVHLRGACQPHPHSCVAFIALASDRARALYGYVNEVASNQASDDPAPEPPPEPLRGE